MRPFSWNIKRNGYVPASELEKCFNLIINEFLERLDDQDTKIKRLENELATERRLRLGMGRQK